MRTPRIYIVQKGLAGLQDLAVVSALRGPDNTMPSSHLKCYTAAVIRYWVEGATLWGAVTALPFVVVVDAAYYGTAHYGTAHYGTHIRYAAKAIGLPVLKISGDLLETLTYPPTILSDDAGWQLWTRSWIKACYLEAGKERPDANLS